jgi:hypothetical protein
MEEAGQLLTLTQVAISVAGFAGIIGAFQFNDVEKISRGDAIGLALIVNTGLMSAFYSILPLLLSNFGLDDATVWSISSVLTCLIYASFNITFAYRLKKFRSFKTINKIMIISLFIVSFFIILINFMNAANIVFKREFGPFYLSLVYSIGSVCYMFSRMLLRPVWRSIKKQESEYFNGNDLP